jgi:hypothetical protein
MNGDGDNGSGAPAMHYGHSQMPLHPATSQPLPPSQHVPGTNPTTYGTAHSILMNNATANARRRPGEDEQDHLRSGMQPTPLFERLVTEEVQELKAYARIIESQNRRLAELERVHGDLEARLEQECNARMKLEETLGQHELAWSDKYNKLEKERDHWKEVVQLEQTKNSRLIEQVVRKEKDIQKMLQRKVRRKAKVGSSQVIAVAWLNVVIRVETSVRSTTGRRALQSINPRHPGGYPQR